MNDRPQGMMGDLGVMEYACDCLPDNAQGQIATVRESMQDGCVYKVRTVLLRDDVAPLIAQTKVLRDMVRILRPVHYPGECGHCGIDALPPEDCPTLRLIAEVDELLQETTIPPIARQSQRAVQLLRDVMEEDTRRWIFDPETETWVDCYVWSVAAMRAVLDPS